MENQSDWLVAINARNSTSEKWSMLSAFSRVSKWKVPGNIFYSNLYSDQLRQKIKKIIMPLKFDPLITASMHSKEIDWSV